MEPEKKPKAERKSPNLTIRLSEDDRLIFEFAARHEHFDTLAAWVKQRLRTTAVNSIRNAEQHGDPIPDNVLIAAGIKLSPFLTGDGAVED